MELNEDDEKSYFEYIQVTCTEKAVSKTFGGWVLDPPVENIDLKCVPSDACNLYRGKAPIPVEDDDKKVWFAPFNNFLDEPLTKFGPVEIGGNIFAYCKDSGNFSTVQRFLLSK